MATQQTNISLGYGIRRTPSLGADGELSECVNLIPHGGEMVNIQPPKRVDGLTLQSDEKLVHIHKTSLFEHYITYEEVADGADKVFVYVDSRTEIGNGVLTGKVKEIKSEGNVLVVSTSTGVFMFLWKAVDSAYLYINSDGFNPKIRPYLCTRLMDNEDFMSSYGTSYTNNSEEESISTNLTGDGYITVEQCKKLNTGSSGYISFTPIQQTKIFNRAFGLLNSAFNLLTENSQFYAPFYVRCALRMYDGSHILHTSPVLMNPTSWGKPVMKVDISNSTSSPTATFDPIIPSAQLGLDIDLSGFPWKDLVSHLDVYVSAPIVDYTQDSKTVFGVLKREYEEVGASRAEYIPQQLYSKYATYQRDQYEIGRIEYDYSGINSKVTVKSDGIFAKNGKYSVSKYAGYAWNFLLFPKDYASELVNTQGKAVSNYKLTPEQISQYGLTEVIQQYVTSGDYDVYILESSFTPLVNHTSGVYYKFWHLLHRGNSERTASEEVKYILDVRRSDGSSFESEIESCSSFFLVNSIPISELEEEGFKRNGLLDIKKFTLVGLQSRESLSDTGQARTSVVTSSIFGYNNRLNYVIEKESLPKTDQIAAFHAGTKDVGMSATEDVVVAAWIETEKNGQSVYREIELGTVKKKKADGELEDTTLKMSSLYKFTYPDSDAKKLYFIVNGAVQGISGQTIQSPYKVCSIVLKPHGILNLSQAFNMFDELPYTVHGGYSSVATAKQSPEISKCINGSKQVVYGNKITLSSVNNPFRFDESLSVTIPTSGIISISTAARALSQGQFGQFPLYAFCKDGIWALSVSDTGVYSSRQAISRDVVSNPASITQIDNAVVFVTNQGLKMVSGSEVTLLSEKVAGYNINENNFIASVQGQTDIVSPTLRISDTAQFVKQLQSAKIVYDYPHSLLHIFMGNSFMHYVMDLESGEFSKQVLARPLKSVVAGYPLSTMQMDNALMQYDRVYEDTPTVREGYLITRSYSFGNPLSKKALYDLRMIGQRTAATRRYWVTVYISDDNVNWYKLKSLKMKSAKYYRFVIVAKMTDLETLSGLSLTYQERYTNKLRGDSQ